MAKEWAKAFYKSKAWQECRTGYIASVNGLCETCLKANRIRTGYIVHHTIYLTPNNISDPNISLNWNYLRYDCQDCHNKEHHHKKDVTRKGLIFNTKGELVEG